MKRFLSVFLALAVLTFFALFLFLPLFTVVAEGCDPAILREVFRSRLYLKGMMNSLAIAVVTTGIVFLISIPLAALYDKWDFPGKAACSVMMMAPMILPPFVGALGFQQLLGGTPAEAAAARTRWTEDARSHYLRAKELAKGKGAVK